MVVVEDALAVVGFVGKRMVQHLLQSLLGGDILQKCLNGGTQLLEVLFGLQSGDVLAVEEEVDFEFGLLEAVAELLDGLDLPGFGLHLLLKGGKFNIDSFLSNRWSST